MIDSAAAFIGNPRVRTVVSRKPIIRSMAGGAICSEHTGMESGVGMTTDASSWQTGKLIIRMALLASHSGVTTRQREIGFVVVERNVIPIGWTMTGGAIRSKLPAMLIVLFMAGVAV